MAGPLSQEGTNGSYKDIRPNIGLFHCSIKSSVFKGTETMPPSKSSRRSQGTTPVTGPTAATTARTAMSGRKTVYFHTSVKDLGLKLSSIEFSLTTTVDLSRVDLHKVKSSAQDIINFEWQTGEVDVCGRLG